MSKAVSVKMEEDAIPIEFYKPSFAEVEVRVEEIFSAMWKSKIKNESKSEQPNEQFSDFSHNLEEMDSEVGHHENLRAASSGKPGLIKTNPDVKRNFPSTEEKATTFQGVDHPPSNASSGKKSLGKIETRRQSLRNVNESNHVDIFYENDVRDKTFLEPYSDLDQSELICIVCRKTFSCKSRLLLHLPIHTGKRPYDCDTCGKKFSRKGNLQVHLRVHTGEKPYKCDICGKTFTRSGNLQEHLRVHTGKKPFKCDICGKKFAVTQNLQKHRSIHTLSVDSHNHIRTHLDEKPFKCEVCGEKVQPKPFSKKSLYTSTKKAV